MRIAIAHWQDRVSPVFDVSDRLLLIDIEDGRDLKREDNVLNCRGPFERAREVYRLGVQVLLCGAVSRPLETALFSSGVRVIGFICGDLGDVLNAYINGRLTDKCFQMPGYGEKRTKKGDAGVKTYRRRMCRGTREGERCIHSPKGASDDV